MAFVCIGLWLQKLQKPGWMSVFRRYHPAYDYKVAKQIPEMGMNGHRWEIKKENNLDKIKVILRISDTAGNRQWLLERFLELMVALYITAR